MLAERKLVETEDTRNIDSYKAIDAARTFSIGEDEVSVTKSAGRYCAIETAD